MNLLRHSRTYVLLEKYIIHSFIYERLLGYHFHVLNFRSSVQFSHSIVSSSFRPDLLQHARPPCPSPTPRVYANSCPLSRWCHPTISSSAVPSSSCFQSFPASGSFQMSQFFAQSALTVIFKLIISGLTRIILIVLDTVNLQFQGPFVPISLRSLLEIVAAHIWVQSAHHVVNSTWCLGICKTAHRIWLKKELKVLDCA